MNSMEKHKWAKEIHAWADGADIEGRWGNNNEHRWIKDRNPSWNDPARQFRIADPYRDLKEAAKDPTKQIRHLYGGVWDGWRDFGTTWTWCLPPENYQIRDKPKEKRKVKLYQWLYKYGNESYLICDHTTRNCSKDQFIVRRLDETMIEVEVDDD